MSTYPQVISELTRLSPQATVGLGELLNARAWAALKPDDLYITGIRGDDTIRTMGGDAAFGIKPRTDFNILNLSGNGFRMQWPAAAHVRGPYTYTYANLPSYLRRSFSYHDLSYIYGSGYADFIAALKKLYTERIFGRGILSPDEEWGTAQLLEAGMPVWMAPKSGDAKWSAAAKAFDAPVTEYYIGEYEKAAFAAKFSAANVAFWNGVYATVQFVAEAPGKFVEAAAETAWKHNKSFILLAGLAAGGYFLVQSGALKKVIRA